jgi:hypothetical protein
VALRSLCAFFAPLREEKHPCPDPTPASLQAGTCPVHADGVKGC